MGKIIIAQTKIPTGINIQSGGNKSATAILAIVIGSFLLANRLIIMGKNNKKMNTECKELNVQLVYIRFICLPA